MQTQKSDANHFFETRSVSLSEQSLAQPAQRQPQPFLAFFAARTKQYMLHATMIAAIK
jgi:hypothetical protein